MDRLPDELLPYVLSLDERRSLNRRSRLLSTQERIAMALGLEDLLREDKISYLKACLKNGNDAAFFVKIEGYSVESSASYYSNRNSSEARRYTYEGTLSALDSVFLERHIETGPKEYREDFTSTHDVDIRDQELGLQALLDLPLKDLAEILDFDLLASEQVVLEEHQIVLGYWDEYQVAYQADLYQDLVEEDPLTFEQELQKYLLNKLDVDYQESQERWIRTNCMALGLPTLGTSFEVNYERLRKLLLEMMG